MPLSSQGLLFSTFFLAMLNMYSNEKTYIAALAHVLTTKTDPITPVLASLHWFPEQYIFRTLLLAYKFLSRNSPKCLQSLLSHKTPPCSMRWCSASRLCVPLTRLCTVENWAFISLTPRLWNWLADHSKGSHFLSAVHLAINVIYHSFGRYLYLK